MARFRFALDPLLHAREVAEREKQLVVAEIERERIAAEERLRQFQDEIMSGKQVLRSSLIGTLDIKMLRSRAGLSLQSVRRAQETVLQLAGIHRRLESARQELVEASRRRRAIELLREKRYDAWKSALDKKDEAALDELAILKAARRSGGEFETGAVGA